MHFGQNDFDYKASHFDTKTGLHYSVPLQVKRPKKDAVPSIFTGYPTSLKKAVDGSRRLSPERKKTEIENSNISKAIALSIIVAEDYNKSRSVRSI